MIVYYHEDVAEKKRFFEGKVLIKKFSKMNLHIIYNDYRH